MSAEKNFGLTKEEFEQLVQRLENGDEELFAQIFIPYSSACIKHLQRKFQLDYQRSYDFALDALLYTRQKILDGKLNYGNLQFYFIRRAHFLALNFLNRSKEIPINYSAHYSFSEVQDAEATYNSSLFKGLKRILKLLSTEERKFIDDHYFKEIKIVNIARNQGVSPATLRKRKQRLLAKLGSLMNSKNIKRELN